jgi:hypothetical protein
MQWPLKYAVIMALSTMPLTGSLAVERIVETTIELSDALEAAQPGDFITLMSGEYGGGHYRTGLTGVTIRSHDPTNPAIIRGGVNGIQLSDAIDVTLEHLIFEQQTGNGLNFDDGGSFATPSTGITLRNLTVRDMNATGNNDGIKLSGVTGFLIDKVTVDNWGDGGSAIDPVGSHNGLIQNSIFRHQTGGSSAVRPKGGSKNIRIHANRIEMPGGAGRAIQAGGMTGTEFFRFIDGDSGYEADEIVAAGNLIVDAFAAASYVNIDGGVFHHNWLQNPRNWAMRILNENSGAPIVDTQNGQFTDNVIEYDGAAWNRAVNVGSDTLPASFTFARNQWNNTSGPSNVSLPAPETDGQYGTISVPRAGDQIRWDFPWGHWVVNASAGGAKEDLAIDNAHAVLLATPSHDGAFDPLAADPLSGTWTFSPLPGESVQLAAQSQMILIRPGASSAIPSEPGDYDHSGAVDVGDYQLWTQQLGSGGPALADGNGDGLASLADYTIWRDHVGAVAASNAGVANVAAIVAPRAVAEPSAAWSAMVAISTIWTLRYVACVIPRTLPRCEPYR